MYLPTCMSADIIISSLGSYLRILYIDDKMDGWKYFSNQKFMIVHSG